jgi:DNA-binding transcriptional regulator YbjK
MVFGHAATAAHAEGRKREILVAALRLIASAGVDSVTHRRVAEEAGVVLGSLTYYFDSRDELIREAFRLYIAEAGAFLLALQREIPPETPAALATLIMEMLRREFAEPQMLRAEYEMILYAARDEQVARDFGAYERSLETGLAASLEAMGARRPFEGARTIIHLARGAELQQLANRSEEPRGLRERLLTVVKALVGDDAAQPAARRTLTPEPKRKPARGRMTL